GIFLQYSPLLPQWSYSYDYFNAAQTIAKQVNPYAMQLFALQPAQSQGDTMGFVFQGDNSSYPYPVWSASCILERLNGTDSIVHFSFSNNTLAALEIPSWHSLQDALVIVTNGDITVSHTASLSFQLCPITYPAGSQHTFSSVTPTDTAVVSLKTQTALRCSLTVTAVTDDSLLAAAAKNRLFPATDLFAVSFPATWSSGSSISLAINSTSTLQIAPQTLGVYVWNGAAWSKVPDTVSFTHQSLRATAAVAQPGIYSVFYSSMSEANAVAIYPNPVHLKTGSFVKIAGKNILDIWVYDISGKMISRATAGAQPSPASLPESQSGFNWLLTNASGKTVFPGMYYVCLEYKDAVTQAVKKKKQKILVVP
ncbi:MAG: T9SS type A sorting domain-containing protein, partial [Chitinivibrionales bacterium]